MIVGTGWNADLAVENPCDLDFMLRWLLCKDEPDTGLVRRCRSIGRVVHLKTKLGLLWNPFGKAIGINQRTVARHIDPPKSVSLTVCLTGCFRKHEHVMHDAAIAWTDFNRLHPFVF